MNSKGYTLFELVLVIIILGVLFAGGTVLLRPVLDSWSLAIPREEATDTSSYAMSRMIYEISQLRDKNSVLVATANEFRFTDMSGNVVRYWISGTNVMRNNDILARGVQTLAFSYFDKSHAALPAPQVAPAATNLWQMVIKVIGQKGGQVVTMESEVHPRNLPRS